MIYLDHNATTALLPEVKAALSALPNTPYNPSSIHGLGRGARQLLEEARRDFMAAIGVDKTTHRLVWCASGTEANNWIIRDTYFDAVMVSATEHVSVLQAKEDPIIIPVEKNGLIDLKTLERQLEKQGQNALVSVMWVNNETGIIQPISAIAELVHAAGAYLHVDGVQALGKIPVNVDEATADYVTFSAHKIGGPVGAAALVMRKNAPILKPLLTGGGQEERLRASTENVPAIYGFALAAKLVTESLEQYQQLALWRDKIEASFPETVLVDKTAARVANTTILALSDTPSETQLIHFDVEGIALSSGSACSSGKIESSHVLRAMGIDEKIAKTAIRVSLGRDTTKEHVERFIAIGKEMS